MQREGILQFKESMKACFAEAQKSFDFLMQL